MAEPTQVIAHLLVEGGHELRRLRFACQAADRFVVKPNDDTTDNALGVGEGFAGDIHHDDAAASDKGEVTPMKARCGFEGELQPMPPRRTQSLITDFHACFSQASLYRCHIRRPAAGIAQNDVGMKPKEQIQ
jgi:hypothetical protein